MNIKNKNNIDNNKKYKDMVFIIKTKWKFFLAQLLFNILFQNCLEAQNRYFKFL